MITLNADLFLRIFITTYDLIFIEWTLAGKLSWILFDWSKGCNMWILPNIFARLFVRTTVRRRRPEAVLHVQELDAYPGQEEQESQGWTCRHKHCRFFWLNQQRWCIFHWAQKVPVVLMIVITFDNADEFTWHHRHIHNTSRFKAL